MIPQDVTYALRAEIQFTPGGAWTDVTGDLLGRAVRISRGRQNELADPMTTEVQVHLHNLHGRYTPDRPQSPHWPGVGVGASMRLVLAPQETPGLQLARFTGEIAGWEPLWPEGDLSQMPPGPLQQADLDDEDAERGEAYVRVSASGVLRRLGQGRQPALSALRRYHDAYESRIRDGQAQLSAYLPCEDPDGSRTIANIVPGALDFHPNQGQGRRPLTGQDPGPAGSAPLPEWPVVPTPFGWGTGATVLPSDELWWMVTCVFRVPPGTGQCRLVEWRTNGSLDHWTLGVTASGQLQATASDDPDDGSSPTVVTYASSTAGPVDTGGWLHCAVTALRVTATSFQVRLLVHGIAQSMTQTSGQRLGTVERIRPRPTISSPTDDHEPVGLGHVAVITAPAVGSLEVPDAATVHVPAPVDGYLGEGATERLVRFAEEEDITLDLLPGRQLVSSSHTAVFGFAPDADLQVFGGTEGDCEVLVRVRVVDGASARFGVAFRAKDFGNAVVAKALLGSTNNLSIASGAPELALRRWRHGDFVVGTWYWFRAQIVGRTVRLAVWHDGDAQDGWDLTVSDPRVLDPLDAPSGVWAETVSSPATIEFSSIVVRHLDRGPAMGPQRMDTADEVIAQAYEVDGGLLAESVQPGLEYRSRMTMINQPVALTLDAAAGDILPTLAPTRDDQMLRNAVRASRIDGSEVTITDERDIARHGRYATSVTVNVAGDEDLASQAGWRVHLGTWPQMRYPVVSPDFNHRPQRIEPWSLLRLGDKLALTGLPPQHPQQQVELLLQGYAETADPDTWLLDANCSPAGVWTVGEVADPQEPAQAGDAPVRYDHAGSVTVAEFTAGQSTQLLVATVLGPHWSTDPRHWLHIAAGALVLDDDFGRVVADGWGTAPTGQEWVRQGGAATDFEVDGAVASCEVDTTDTNRLMTVDGAGLDDFDLSADVRLPSGLGAGTAEIAAIARHSPGATADDDTHYQAVLHASASTGLLTMRIGVMVGGSHTLLSETVTVAETITAGQWWRLRFQGVGGALQASVWPAAAPQPATWQAVAVDTTLTSGRVGFKLRTGGAAASTVWEVDDVQAHTGVGESRLWLATDGVVLAVRQIGPPSGGVQQITVDAEPVNRVHKPVAAGAAVRLAQPAVRT